MPISQDEILKQRQELYESTPLRDDLNDAEAEILLKWGEKQVERMAAFAPEDFEQACRFLRQLIKNINRFVGQREYNDRAGQEEYMAKVQQWLPKLGYPELTIDALMSSLPDDSKDMAGTLQALLNVITPDRAVPAEPPLPTVGNTPSGGLGAAMSAQATQKTETPSPPDAPVDNPPKNDTIGQKLSTTLGDLFGHDEKSE